jgi:hypothetical protein
VLPYYRDKKVVGVFVRFVRRFIVIIALLHLFVSSSIGAAQSRLRLNSSKLSGS